MAFYSTTKILNNVFSGDTLNVYDYGSTAEVFNAVYDETNDALRVNLSGFTGGSGTSGTSGVSGTSGTSGVDGAAGTSGSVGTSGTSGVDGSFGGLTSSWKWSGTTQYDDDPGTNYLNCDSDEARYVEGIYISDLDFLNADQSTWLLNLKAGNGIRLTKSNDEYMDLGTITSVTDNGTWVRINVNSGGTMLNGPFNNYWTDGSEVHLSYIINGDDGSVGASGTSGVDGVDGTISGITSDTGFTYTTPVLSTPKLLITTDPGASSVFQMYNTSGVLYNVTIVGSTLTATSA